MRNTIRKIVYKTTRQERSFGKVDIERKESCGTWHVFYDLGEETNPRTKFGEIEQHARRGGILYLIVIPLCPSYSWFSNMIYCLCSNFVEMFEYMLLMLAWFIDTISTWLLFLCCWYMSNPHHILLYILLANYTILQLSLLSWFPKYLLKFSYTCMALDILWYLLMICVRGVPPRPRMILIDDGYKVEKRCMHVSCQFYKLLMPLHATWGSLKFPAICPPVVKYF